MSTASTALKTTNLAGDATALGALRAKAAKDPKAAVKEVAKQFEALFMQELLKSMRAASQNAGFLENEGSKMGTEMLDAQYATQMAGAKGGLADAIAKQLERQLQAQMQPQEPAPALPEAPGAPVNKVPGSAAAQFVQQHLAAAQRVEKETGIKASFTLGQAAHESGWGRREIRNADGSDSHNLFGIKATADWKGAVTEITTTEVVNGQARKVAAKFRSYPHFEAAFADYSRMLSKSPRYAQAVATGQDAAGFAQSLQKAGYATDPAYAEKLTRVINTTLRLQRAVT
jgi:peptidoglycan hydrolase FlgJ